MASFIPDSRAMARAVALSDAALHGRAPMPISKASVAAQRLHFHPWYEAAITLLLVGQLVLGFWELPADASAASTAALSLDACVLAAVALDAVLVQRPAHGPARWLRRGWVRVKLGAVLAMGINLAVTFASRGAYPYGAMVLRPLLLLERKEHLRKVAKAMAASVPHAMVCAVLVVTNLLLWAVAAYVIFSHMDGDNCKAFFERTPKRCSYFAINVPGADLTQSCRDFFSSLENSMAHLLELQAGSAYPVLFMPLMRCSPAIALFFVVR